jgi:hypothetical protein
VLGVGGVEIGSAERVQSLAVVDEYEAAASVAETEGEGMPLSAIGGDSASDTSRRRLDDYLELAVIK